MDRLELINAIRRDAVSVPETRLPLNVFPNKVQDLIFNLGNFENYNKEYCASVILSAIASAIGNSHQIHIKGGMVQQPCPLYDADWSAGIGKDSSFEIPVQAIHRT